MSNEFDNLDEWLKDQLADTGYEFNESWWLEAKAQMKKERKRTWWFRFGNFFVLGCLIFLAGIVSMAVYFHLGNSSSQAQSGSGLNQEALMSSNTKSNRSQLALAINSHSQLENNQFLEVKKDSSSKLIKASHQDVHKNYENPKRLRKGHAELVHPEAQRGDNETHQLPEIHPKELRDGPQWNNISSRYLNKLQSDSPTPKSFPSSLIQLLSPKLVQQAKTPTKRHYRFALFAEAGTTQFNQSQSAFYGGGRLQFTMGKKLALSTGLLFDRLGQDLPERKFIQATYGFGSTTKEFQLKTTSLDYVEIPLQVLVPISPKQTLGVGLSYLQLINSHELMHEFTDGSMTKTTNQSGYYNNIQRSDYMFMLSYSYAILPSFLLKADACYGLTDITKATSSTTNSFDRNKGFKLGFAYQLNHR